MNVWVLIRGLGRDARHWGVFLKDFTNAVNGDHVVTLDTLGNGRFAEEKSPLTINQFTEHCRQQLSNALELTPDHRVHLVALSLGGMIALDWAQRYPDEIDSLTLINTSVANLTPWYQRIQLSSLSQLIKAVFINNKPLAVERVVLALTSNQQASPHPMLNEWVALREHTATSRKNLLRQLIAASRFSLRSPITAKMLIICSPKDKLVAHQASLDLHQRINSHLVTHPWAGHDIALDDPDWLIAQLIETIHDA
ncbi:alpha/beta fold hydrolase [Thalassotalea ganghwensis]